MWNNLISDKDNIIGIIFDSFVQTLNSDITNLVYLLWWCRINHTPMGRESQLILSLRDKLKHPEDEYQQMVQLVLRDMN